jgi:hypothetical protein
MSILDPKQDVAALAPEIDKSVATLAAAISTALKEALDGYTVTISPITITVTKKI